MVVERRGEGEMKRDQTLRSRKWLASFPGFLHLQFLGNEVRKWSSHLLLAMNRMESVGLTVWT